MRTLLILLACSIFLISCNSSKKETVDQNHAYTNDLIHETSPYLLLHAHNPVNWKPWNNKSLNEAKTSQKLMIISIGYAACHWCHVMERESFQDSVVAAIMNEHYISVKVDREERPDVDQTYINAVQLMTGNAGWPLNAITLPDGRPVFGGTYFRKEEWIQALEQLQKIYEETPEKLEEYATNLAEGIKNIDLVVKNTNEIDFSTYETQPVLDKWKSYLDTLNGGTKGAPKFMMPNQLAYLLRNAVQYKDEKLLSFVELSLHKMAFGGVYDQVGGGFARYSVDDRWHVPHFEKMLYDNAQLVSLYSNAYSATKNELYKEVVEETLSFIAREMTNEEGVFYSSLDAESINKEGAPEEGAFYTFDEEELKQIITPEDWELFKSYYNINEFGKWQEENTHVLIKTKNDAEISSLFSISKTSLKEKIVSWKKLLYTAREKRKRPRIDDKTLTSWNALMIKGYVDAYKSFNNPKYLEAAEKNATFILDNQIQPDGSLLRVYKDGKSTINGYLEDYAATIDAFIGLYEITLNDKWILKAKELTDFTFVNFFNEESNMFYFTSKKDDAIITRNFEYRDNVIPSSNSTMGKNLFVLSHHFDSELYRITALQMLKNVQPEMEKYLTSFSNWIDLLANYQNKYFEVVVVGKDAVEKVTEINTLYLPQKLIAGSTSNSSLPLLQERYTKERTLIYVCVNNTCKLPVEKVEDALKLLKKGF